MKLRSKDKQSLHILVSIMIVNVPQVLNVRLCDIADILDDIFQVLLCDVRVATDARLEFLKSSVALVDSLLHTGNHALSLLILLLDVVVNLMISQLLAD